MKPIFYILIVLLWNQLSGGKSEIKGHVFYTNILLNAEVYGYTSICTFYESEYSIETIDNSHGQMDKRVTEKGTFKVHGNHLIMKPKSRFVCPKLIQEWGYKGGLFYTNDMKMDSIYSTTLHLCTQFSEYRYVTLDTLSTEKIEILRITDRSYTITKSEREIILECKNDLVRERNQYPIQDYSMFRRSRD